jgi:haloalkane dehalogenase
MTEYPFAPHYLELQGLRYHYVDEGQGEPLLCVHGNPTWSFYWRRLISEFSPERRVIAPDHIGMGRSDKPQDYRYRLGQHISNLEALIYHLNLRDITLVVHDWGGPIGLGVAARHPDRFKRLVITNTAAFRAPILPWMLGLVRTPGVGDLLVRGLNAFVLGTVHLARARPLSAAARAGYLAPYDSWANRVAVLRFVQDIPMHAGHPSYPDLVELERGLPRLRDKPIQLFWGEKDFIFSPYFLRRFQEWFPEARVRSLPQAGHLLTEDAPEELVGTLREFLA